MRLALNFPRIDPTRGGAETYIVDLCRSWCGPDTRWTSTRKAGRKARYRRRSVASPWPPPGEAADSRSGISLATPRPRHRPNGVRLLGRLHQHLRHDVIIPQGGVHRGSLQANARRFSSGRSCAGLYVLGKTANPKYWLYRAIENRQYDPAR